MGTGAAAAPVVKGWRQGQKGGNNFKKTKLCTLFEEGHCPRAQCTFAHGEAELGTFQTPQGGGGGGGGGGGIKSQLCRHWSEKGFCQSGSSCGFAHGEEELGTPRGNGGAVGKQSGKGGPSAADKELFNFKTTMCNNFSNTGTCIRGDRCSFAHGEGELMEPGQAKSVVEQMASDGIPLDGFEDAAFQEP